MRVLLIAALALAVLAVGAAGPAAAGTSVCVTNQPLEAQFQGGDLSVYHQDPVHVPSMTVGPYPVPSACVGP